jgi:hypothetical protein
VRRRDATASTVSPDASTADAYATATVAPFTRATIPVAWPSAWRWGRHVTPLAASAAPSIAPLGAAALDRHPPGRQWRLAWRRVPPRRLPSATTNAQA